MIRDCNWSVLMRISLSEDPMSFVSTCHPSSEQDFSVAPRRPHPSWQVDPALAVPARDKLVERPDMPCAQCPRRAPRADSRRAQHPAPEGGRQVRKLGGGQGGAATGSFGTNLFKK